MCNKQLITMRYLIYCKSLKQKYSIRSLRSRSLMSLRISDYQNIPLSHKIRLNQVCPANKIHP